MSNNLFAVKHRSHGVVSEHPTKPEAKKVRDELNSQEPVNHNKSKEQWDMVYVVTEGSDHWRNSW